MMGRFIEHFLLAHFRFNLSFTRIPANYLASVEASRHAANRAGTF